MADIGKVTPGSPVIPPVPQDRRIDDQDQDEQERKRKQQRQDEKSEHDSPDNNDDKGKGDDGIDVYV